MFNDDNWYYAILNVNGRNRILNNNWFNDQNDVPRGYRVLFVRNSL